MLIKKIALVFLCVFILIFAFHQSLMQWALQMYLSHAAGFSLNYESVQAKPNQLIFNAPSIVFDEEKGNVRAESMSIAYAFHPFAQSLEFEIDFVSPEVELFPSQEFVEKVSSQLGHSSKWVTVNWRIKSREGKLKIWQDQEFYNFIFALDHCSNKECHYSLTSGNEVLNFSKKSIQAENFPLEKLNPFLHALFPLAREWIFTSGVLNGSLENALVLQEVGIQHKKSHTRAKFNEIILNEKDALAVDFSHGSLTFADEDLYGMIHGLKGKLFMDQEIHLSAEGIWSASEEDSQVQIEAHFDSQEVLLDVALYHLNQEEKPSFFRLKGENLLSVNKEFDLNFSNVRQREVAFVQRALDTINPEMSPLKYLTGTLNGTIGLKFNENRLSSIFADDLDVADCFLVIKPWEIALGAKHILGQFALDVDCPQESLNAAIEIKEGTLVLTGLDSTLWNFTHIETKLEIQNGKVLPSFASVELAGLKGKAEFKNSMLLSFSGKVSDLKPFIPERFHQGIDRSLNEDPILLNAEIMREEKSIGIKGLLEIKDLRVPFGYKNELGWFKINTLLLEKFVSPFLFPENELELSGIIAVEGTFDGSRIAIEYGGQNIQLKNEHLTIELPKIEKKEAHHLLDISTYHHTGLIPLINASYFDRETGLLFTDIQAKAIFEDQKVEIWDMEGFSNNIYFAGHALVDYSSEEKGTYTTHLHAENFDGSFSSFQRFFEHFDRPFYFTKIPLEGIVDAGPKGLDLFLDIHADNYSFSCVFDGSFSEGKILCPHADLALHELSFNFTYDQPQNKLECNDIQGMVLLGKPEEVEEYSLHADKIHFTDLENEIAFFDVHIKDAFHDLVRIKGKTGRESKDSIAVHFDLDKTHVGTIFPHQFTLSLANWDRIEEVVFACSFELKQFLQEITHFGLPNIFGMPKRYFHEIEKTEGNFDLNLRYLGVNETFDFNLQGKNVFLNNHPFKNVVFTGYQRNERWFIEQLEMDDVVIAAELMKMGNWIKVDFLGLRYGPFFLLGLEGDYHLGDPSFHAKINLIEGDLNYWNEKGKFKGNGELILTKGERFTLETTLDASLSGVEIKGAKLSDVPHFKVHFLSDEGLSIKQFNTEITTATHLGQWTLDLNLLKYSFMHEALKITGLNSKIDASLLPWVGDSLHRHLPNVIDQKLAGQIGDLKQEGALVSSLNLNVSSIEKNLHIAFGDGFYHLLGEKRKLKNFTLELGGDELKISSIYTLNQKPIWVTARYLPNRTGTVLLASTDETDHPALVIDFQKDKEAGLVIKKAKGYLAGLNVDLKENKGSDAYVSRLTGEVEVNGREVRSILSSTWLELFDSLKIGKGYKLQGDFEFLKGNNLETRFFGRLIGKDLELKGYQFDQLSLQVIYESQLCQLLNCTLSDTCGTLYMGNLRAERQHEGDWKLNIPLLTIHQMQPSLLKPVEAASFPRKPLTIRQLSLENISGMLGDSNSFIAEGKLYFTNPQKKNLQNVLFTIPKEILTHIGLNLSVLTPVTGTIQFNLKNGHFILNKFKDVYSEGRISKFYLPSSGVPATVDLKGNVNVQVRFKQSTLLLKLAEMFTITVKGHLTSPRYSLQRQKYLKQEEVFSSGMETL